MATTSRTVTAPKAAGLLPEKARCAIAASQKGGVHPHHVLREVGGLVRHRAQRSALQGSVSPSCLITRQVIGLSAALAAVAESGPGKRRLPKRRNQILIDLYVAK